MRKLLLLFSASLLCLGAWAQDELIIIDRTFDLTCIYPEDWNDMTEQHMFNVYGTYTHPYDRSGRIEYMVDYSDEWMDLTWEMLQPGDEIMTQISATLDSTESWHSFQFRIIDAENETIYIEPFEITGIRASHFSGIEDKVYTGDSLTQENVSCAWLYPTQYQIVNYRNNVEVGTAYFDIIGVYPYSIGKCTFSFQILDANNPEWALLLDLRAALVLQGNEEWTDRYWPTTNGIASAANWYGVTMSEGHVTELDLSVYGLQLDSIPQAAFRFPYLSYLDASDKDLTGNIEHIVDSTDIPCAASLDQLILSNNLFSGNVGALAHLFPNLRYLSASNNKITEVKPMISPNVADPSLYNQQIDSVFTIDFRAPLTREGLMATLPSILLYNHYEQTYVKENSFTIVYDPEDYDAWSMYFYAGVDPEYYGAEFQVATWEADPAYRYNSSDTLYLQGEGTCRVQILFKSCDADFNSTVDIADLQMMLNYIMGSMEYSTVINFTATDLYPDSILNVQDVVRMVDTLLTNEVPVVFEAPRRAVATETADAALYWLNGDLHLRSNKAVASMQIEVATEGTVTWALNGEWMKGERANGEKTKVVLYSLNGATLPAETDILIAHCTGEATVRAAALSDPAAKRISVRLNSPAVATGVQNVQSDHVQCTKLIRNGQLYIMYKGTMYDVQGKRVNDQINRK